MLVRTSFNSYARVLIVEKMYKMKGQTIRFKFESTSNSKSNSQQPWLLHNSTSLLSSYNHQGYEEKLLSGILWMSTDIQISTKPARSTAWTPRPFNDGFLNNYDAISKSSKGSKRKIYDIKGDHPELEKPYNQSSTNPCWAMSNCHLSILKWMVPGIQAKAHWVELPTSLRRLPRTSWPWFVGSMLPWGEWPLRRMKRNPHCMLGNLNCPKLPTWTKLLRTNSIQIPVFETFVSVLHFSEVVSSKLYTGTPVRAKGWVLCRVSY